MSSLESGALSIGITSGSDVGCPTATLRLSLRAGFLEKCGKWRTPVIWCPQGYTCGVEVANHWELQERYSQEGKSVYTIDWVGTVALGVLQDGKPRFALALEDGQEVPAEFKVGDEIRVVNHPADPASVAMGMNYGYYEVTHVPSGKAINIMHRVYEYMFK